MAGLHRRLPSGPGPGLPAAGAPVRGRPRRGLPAATGRLAGGLLILGLLLGTAACADFRTEPFTWRDLVSGSARAMCNADRNCDGRARPGPDPLR
jgi:hypothetical protein